MMGKILANPNDTTSPMPISKIPSASFARLFLLMNSATCLRNIKKET
jgi:hypothetical protein